MFIIASEAGLYRSGLHGWVRNIDEAYRFTLLSHACNYVRLYHPRQQAHLHVLEEIERDGKRDYVRLDLDD